MLGLLAVLGGLAALVFPAQSLAEPTAGLDLQVSGEGRIVATIEHPTALENATIACTGWCMVHYIRDRVVTLRAEPVGSSSFGS
jgi:hypothetical protein